MSDAGASGSSPAPGSPPPRAFAPPPVARRLLDAPPIEGARIKERPGDFIVEELPLYEPSGEGEHLYLRIVKEGMSHHEMVDVLCAHFGVDAQAIGTAGMKDRQAVTGQTVSVHLPRRPELRSIQEPRIQVVWATWHGNKLRRGHLAGNRFSIRVRGVEPFRAPAAWRAIRELEARGVPNGFGPQRFGMRSSNHVLGEMLLGARHDELLRHQVASNQRPRVTDLLERQAPDEITIGDDPERASALAVPFDDDERADAFVDHPRGQDAQRLVRFGRHDIAHREQSDLHGVREPAPSGQSSRSGRGSTACRCASSRRSTWRARTIAPARRTSSGCAPRP